MFSIPRTRIFAYYLETTVLNGPSRTAAPSLNAHATPQESLKNHDGP
jgi:hypothetical protein